jgi:hypothetical protein
MTLPTPQQIKAITELSGLAASDEVAERIVQSMAPAFEGFSAVAGTLPFDLEPATFLVVQNTKAAK